MTQEEIDKLVKEFTFQALNFNVILKKVENKNETESGLDVSSVSLKDEKYRKAVVVSIGVDCPQDVVKLGDFVLFDETKSSKLTLNAIEYCSLYFADLTMVF